MIETDAPFLIYTLHFDPAVGRFQHYIGSTRTNRVRQRLRDHAHGYGACLTSRAARKRSAIILVHLEPAHSRELEKIVKRRGHYDKRCFLCNAALTEPAYVADLQAHLDLFKEPTWQPLAFSPA